jgi:hypothetical protein
MMREIASKTPGTFCPFAAPPTTPADPPPGSGQRAQRKLREWLTAASGHEVKAQSGLTTQMVTESIPKEVTKVLALQVKSDYIPDQGGA